MYICYARLVDHASFVDSGDLEFSEGINLIIGANNSGKSALLRSLISPLSNNSTRDGSAISVERKSSIALNITTSINDLFRRNRHRSTTLTFPFGSINDNNAGSLFDKFLSDPEAMFQLEGVRIAGSGISPVKGASIPAFRTTEAQSTMQVAEGPDGIAIRGRTQGQDDLLNFLEDPESESIFYFNAQRVNIGRIGISDEIRLKPDASNLPTVLANIQSTKPATFELIEQHLSDIMGGVQRITVVPSGGHFEIMLWPSRAGPYSGVSFSLNESGSGIAQALAIIAAIVLHQQAVIIIDEINTHLHPAAIKKLFVLIKTKYNQHQYIISCHSPDVIFTSGADLLLSIQKEDLNSVVTAIPMKTAEDARRIAGLLGFSMLDVFGNDRVIWVEGPTEEILFPFILEKSQNRLPPEIGICAVGVTNGFSASITRRNEVLAIYENAGKRLAPLLLGMAFGLDREGLSDEEAKRLESSKKKLRFLPRRCVENYFLNPEAISQVLVNLGESVGPEEVATEILRIAKEREFGAPGPSKGTYGSSTWLRWIDGAKVLAHLFTNLSYTRQEFRKTRDVLSLAEATLIIAPDTLDELTKYVANLVRIAEKDTSP